MSNHVFVAVCHYPGTDCDEGSVVTLAACRTLKAAQQRVSDHASDTLDEVPTSLSGWVKAKGPFGPEWVADLLDSETDERFAVYSIYKLPLESQ